MNLNNKKLAIVLSVVAVVLLVYQIFFNKSTPDYKRHTEASSVSAKNIKPSQAAPVQQSPTQTQQSQSTQSTASSADSPAVIDGGGGPLIDANSPILLKRIPVEMAEPYPLENLPDEYGLPIFTLGEEKKAEPKKSDAPPPLEQEFILNGIIIDKERKTAIINNTILKENQLIGGARVLSIRKGEVILEVNNERISLSTNSRIKRVRLIGGTGEQ